MRDHRVNIHYTPKQVCREGIAKNSYSQSPLKPQLVVDQLQKRVLGYMMEVNSDIKPFRKRDFLNAHKDQYVHEFFAGVGSANSNGLPWSKQLAKSVRYTNSSLFTAIEKSIETPNEIHISPTSGFHHAKPDYGMGFCTFSGQVIASMKIWRKYKMRGAYLDLDGHFGNSIPNSKRFIKDKYGMELDDIIVANVNPIGQGEQYMQNFKDELLYLEDLITLGKLDYVVWCHGADSHKDDDLGNQLTTDQWVRCSEIFYIWLRTMRQRYNIDLPCVAALFGGYRSDDYQSVINLHLLDIYTSIKILYNRKVYIKDLVVKPKK